MTQDARLPDQIDRQTNSLIDRRQTRGMAPRLLTDAQMRDVVTTFDVEWDA